MTDVRIYRNREDAGEQLAHRLLDLALEDPMVFGLVRGGLEVAAPVARELGVALEPLIVRKVGHPQQPELGVGAIAPDGSVSLDDRNANRRDLDERDLQRVIDRERAELERRQNEFTGGRVPDVRGRVAIVVDDGIATGVSAAVAGDYLKRQGARETILAVPVCPPEGLERMRRVYDKVVYLQCLSGFSSVGQWYEDFHQLGDEDVRRLLGPRI